MNKIKKIYNKIKALYVLKKTLSAAKKQAKVFEKVYHKTLEQMNKHVSDR